MEIGEKKQTIMIAYNPDGPYLEAVGQETEQTDVRKGVTRTIVKVFDNFPKMKPGQEDDIIWDFQRMEAAELTFNMKRNVSKEELKQTVKHAVFLSVFEKIDKLLKKSI